MAAVSAELAALREGRGLPDEDPHSEEPWRGLTLPSEQSEQAEQAEQSGEPGAGWPDEQVARERDDRWARWWPEAPQEPAGTAPSSPAPQAGRHSGRHSGRAPALRGAGLGWARWSPVHAVVVLVLIVSAMAVTWWWVQRSQPREVTAAVVPSEPGDAAGSPVPALVSASGSATASPTGGPVADSNAAPGSALVVVHVAGRVRHPGIRELPLGARVADAIAAAGGPRSGVSLTTLNLARKLTDGEQVVVGAPPASPGSAAGPGPAGGATAPPQEPAGAPVNLNTADQAMLETLPGVGPVTAAAIVTHREENGAFTAVDQLIDVPGIGEATLAKLAPLVTV